jgi:hypothetical protein
MAAVQAGQKVSYSGKWRFCRDGSATATTQQCALARISKVKDEAMEKCDIEGDGRFDCV